MSRTSALCRRIVSQFARAAGASRKRGNFNANVSAMLRPNGEGGGQLAEINSRDFSLSLSLSFRLSSFNYSLVRRMSLEFTAKRKRNERFARSLNDTRLFEVMINSLICWRLVARTVTSDRTRTQQFIAFFFL